ncbi:hypothetical protein IBT49_15910 [Erwinia sp. S63]|uniref:DUF7674 family protein n=1 Tax=Erwinia sp. S63 TaxID=2769341 RepID=UPI001909B130|nr:hypothetical protein [Erwinia sp. S63]MBK0097470.1 hypothetical protein [Erwinia sp. S63]
MITETEKLVEYYRSFSVKIDEDVKKCFEFWNPENPPALLLFSAIGRSIGFHIDELNENEKCILFNSIEDGIVSKDQTVSTAVATGLIEALVGAIGEDDNKWKRIFIFLGPETKKHALAWGNLFEK